MRLHHLKVRRGKLVESPVRSVDVPRGKWLVERDLLAHTRRGQAVVQRMELKLKEPDQLPLLLAQIISGSSSKKRRRTEKDNQPMELHSL